MFNTLLNKYIFDKFFAETKATKGMDLFIKEISYGDKEEIILFWDFLGRKALDFLINYSL